MDTLKELFEGNRALFHNLYAETYWDWSIQYPVIRLSFGGAVVSNEQALTHLLSQQLDTLEAHYKTRSPYPEASRRLQHLIQHMHHHTGQRVVVLIDEYDKPILDNLSEPELARQMRNALRDVYAVLKDQDAALKFVLITGVSKFSRVNLFSGLNHLRDITLDPRYSALCGYTETDLDQVFAAELIGLERHRIQDWYNGYNWLGEAVYNPFDLLLYFDSHQLKSYWFETGTPTFLVDFLAQHRWFTPDLMRLQTSEALLSRFDIDAISPEALLWQTGYLTFHHVEELMPGQQIYTLGYPNREVEAALNEALLPVYGSPNQATVVARSHIFKALSSHNLELLHTSMYTVFASMPGLSSRLVPKK